ncbi:MAG: diguanylate cyclase [Pseudomonadota bacterium]
MRGLSTLWLVLALAVWPAHASGADRESSDQRWRDLVDAVFLNLSAEQGLPFGRVPGVAHDRAGFAWLVTSDGLSRWDGLELQRLASEWSDVETDIRILRTGPQGRLWVGTGQALRSFDPDDGSWRQYTLAEGAPFPVTAIDFEDRAEGLVVWAGTGRGVFRLDTRTGSSQHLLREPFDADRTMRTFSVLFAADDAVWVGTSRGLFRQSQRGEAFVEFSLAPELEPGVRISSVMQLSNGSIWVGTPRHGVVSISVDHAAARVPITDFSGEWIFAMAEVRPGLIWLGSYGRGLIEIDTVGGRSRRLEHLPAQKYSLADNEVWTIVPDDNGLVWVGTSRGLSLHDLTQIALLTAFGGTGRDGALRDRAVTSLLELDDERILVGLRQSGVDIVDPQRGRVGTINVDPDSPESALPGGAVEAMAQTDSGQIVLGSNWGVYLFEEPRLARMAFDVRSKAVFTGSLLAQGDTLWAGGSDGLWRLRLNQLPFRSELVEASVTSAFTDPRISSLLAGASDRLTVGTWDGVTWIDGGGEVLSTLPERNAQPATLENGYVTSLLEDQQGRTWIGTSGAGIYVYEPGGSLDHLTRSDGLPSNLTGALLMDLAGRIWASSNGGIAVIDPLDYSISRIGPAGGALVTPYFRQPAVRTRHGELLFGGDGGLTIVKPDRWQPSARSAPLAFTAARAGDQELNPRQAGLSPSEPIVVPAQRNEFSLAFAALDFLAARTIRYRYRLEGFDESWREAGVSDRSINYTSLPPGSYVLSLQATNRQGQWDPATLMRYVTVLPLWHQTPAARWLAALALAALVLLMIRWRTGALRQRQVELEETVALRTRELRQTAAELEQKSAQLRTASLTDPLTGLFNRRFAEHHLPIDQAACFRAYGAGRGQVLEGADLLLFMIDIDHFKRVNDRYGHAAGDAVLKAVPDRLATIFRESDHLVRWGGEEFLVVARNTSRQHAAELARRIVSRFHETPFETPHSPELSLTCSIGFCPMPFAPADPGQVDWQDAVRLADMALYAAKHAGRNAWAGIVAGPALRGQVDVTRWLTDPAAAFADGLIELQSNLPDASLTSVWRSMDRC